MSSDAEIHTLAVPYALHALSDDEVPAFEQHLAQCESCRAEVAEVRETATRLGGAASVPAPAELKARVMERIRQVRPLPPVLDDAVQADARSESVRRRWFPRIAIGLAAAATVAAAALGAELYDTRQELDAAHQHNAELSDMLAAGDVEIATASIDDFGGMVVLSRAQDAAMVMVHGMDAAPSGQVYQLWFHDESGARPAGLLPDEADGDMMMYAAHGVGDASTLGMTLEPAGGSEQPTSDPVMMIDLPA